MQPELILTDDLLRTEYINNKKTIKQISLEYNIPKSTIQYRLNKNQIIRRKPKDLTGQTFGRLYVIGRSSKINNRKCWKCQCSCENKTIIHVPTYLLTSGHTTSCRCKWKITGPNHPSWKGYGEIGQSFWNATIRSAKVRKFEFHISIEYAWNIFLAQNRNCALSGVELSMKHKAGQVRSTASLDRKDSSLGYIEGNIQWVHKKLNRMKVNMLDQEFIEWCHIISYYQKNKNESI